MGPTRGRGNGYRFRFFLLVSALVVGAADIAAAQQASTTGPGTNYFDPRNFNPSMAVVIVVLVAAFFFLGFFSIYIRRCARGPLGGPSEQLGAGRPGVFTFASGALRSRRMRGLDPAVLETFPTMAYADVKAHKVGKGVLECAVCLSEFDDHETLRLLPVCSHAFHTDCIDAWLASHVTCPVCRANLAPDAEAPAAASAATSNDEQDVPAMMSQPPAQEVATAPPEQVTVVTVDADETEEERVRREEATELMRIGSVKRALRSKSARRPAQFPRSHTTGHSLTAAGDSAERYTLRLPEHVLREVVAARSGKMRRTTSLIAFRTGGGDGSTRVSARAGRSVRLGQSGRWPTMSSFARTFSAKLSAWGSARRGDADADAPGKGANSKVAGDGDAAEQLCCEGGACPLPRGRRV